MAGEVGEGGWKCVSLSRMGVNPRGESGRGGEWPVAPAAVAVGLGLGPIPWAALLLSMLAKMNEGESSGTPSCVRRLGGSWVRR